MIKNNTARKVANTLNIASAIVIGGIGAIATTGDGMFGIGVAFIIIAIVLATAFHSLINLTQEKRNEIEFERQQRAIEKRAKKGGKANRTGVHWFWWVFWLIMFFPALIIVAIIHSGRKTRAEIRNLKKEA